VLVAVPLHAAFFQIAENSPAGLGNAFAGGAAIAEDVSTAWYNPAGLARLPGSQIVFGAHSIVPTVEASNVRASSATLPVIGSVPFGGGNGGDAGEPAIVPNFYLSNQLSDRLTLGLGVNAPFGLATDYKDGWAGRYHADRSEIATININPGIAYKVDDRVSVGAGINYQRIEAELSQAVDFATICTVSGGGAFSGACGASGGFLPGTNDGKAKVTADDDAWGYNVGLLWEPQPGTRLGLAYRSKLRFRLDGKVDIMAPANVPAALLTGAGLTDSDAHADVELPATLSLSAHHQINPVWAVMGDVTRTYWSDLPELRIEFDSAQPDSVVTLDLADVNRYSVGATFAPGGNWMYRAGVALDESPTPDSAVRTPRLPDADRTWLAVGAGYRPSERFSLDFAYAYISVEDAKVRKTVSSTSDENFVRGNLSADYEAHTRILSAQARWLLD
jgi:long-chain fatty acid transport protein